MELKNDEEPKLVKPTVETVDNNGPIQSDDYYNRIIKPLQRESL